MNAPNKEKNTIIKNDLQGTKDVRVPKMLKIIMIVFLIQENVARS